MTTYAVTGASGHLGRLAVEELLDRGTSPNDIVAIVRTPAKAAALAERGVQVRAGDYEDPASLDAALDGVTHLLLVSSSEVGKRAAQHQNVIEAAKRAGVRRIAYTSLLRADTSPLGLAPEHKATEELLAASGIAHSLLRNGWYFENYTAQLDSYLATGTVLHAAGEGKIAAASRADLAAAAVVALRTDTADRTVYELGGAAFTNAQLAEAISAATGKSVTAKNVTADELAQALIGAGLDEGTVGFLTSVDTDIAAGALDTDSTDLAKLIGRTPQTLADVLGK